MYANIHAHVSDCATIPSEKRGRHSKRGQICVSIRAALAIQQAAKDRQPNSGAKGEVEEADPAGRRSSWRRRDGRGRTTERRGRPHG